MMDTKVSLKGPEILAKPTVLVFSSAKLKVKIEKP